jgi:hypothetical protein
VPSMLAMRWSSLVCLLILKIMVYMLFFVVSERKITRQCLELPLKVAIPFAVAVAVVVQQSASF